MILSFFGYKKGGVLWSVHVIHVPIYEANTLFVSEIILRV
jgi:hypothetical protein